MIESLRYNCSKNLANGATLEIFGNVLQIQYEEGDEFRSLLIGKPYYLLSKEEVELLFETINSIEDFLRVRAHLATRLSFDQTLDHDGNGQTCFDFLKIRTAILEVVQLISPEEETEDDVTEENGGVVLTLYEAVAA